MAQIGWSSGTVAEGAAVHGVGVVGGVGLKSSIVLWCGLVYRIHHIVEVGVVVGLLEVWVPGRFRAVFEVFPSGSFVGVVRCGLRERTVGTWVAWAVEGRMACIGVLGQGVERLSVWVPIVIPVRVPSLAAISVTVV